MSSSSETNTHVLLIGIDKYLPHEIQIEGGETDSYSDLRGCVNDVIRMEGFFKRKLNIKDDQITKLTASRGEGDEPSEPREQWPTYENIVNSFKEVTEKAEPGDVVYIHYSGHGNSVKTAYEELKGANGIDEALVPTDVGDTEDRYIRDLEFAKLLKDLVDTGCDPRCTIDGCHTAGITRGAADTAIRSIDGIDVTKRSKYSSVAPKEELLETWDLLTGSAERNVKSGSGWLPEPRDYVLMTACRASEVAREMKFNGDERTGVFTHYLLELLEQATPGLSYKVLHDRLLPRVHSRYNDQTPQLQGEGDREVFGNARIKPYYAVSVQEIDEETDPVSMMLNAGQVHGIAKDAQFAIYPPGTSDFDDVNNRQAIVKITEIGAVNSRAEIITDFERGELEQGAQAVLLSAGSLKLIKQVSVERRNDLDSNIDQETPLKAIEKALEEQSRERGWVEPMSDPSEVVYQVALNKTGDAYEIWDTSGTPIENLRPPISTDDDDAASRVVERLVHLARYHAVKDLRNNDPISPLNGKLTVELIGKLEEFDPTDNNPDYEELGGDESGNVDVVNVGEWMFLRIRNNFPPESGRYLDVTVLDLQPGWGIQQLYPDREGGTQVPFAPGEERILPLNAYLPDGYEHGRDVLKVFATLKGTSFRWLELPSLDQPTRRDRATADRAPSNSLEELFAAISVDEHPTRDFSIGTFGSHEWVTAQIEVETRKEEFDISSTRSGFNGKGGRSGGAGATGSW